MTESATLRLDNHVWAREPEEVLEGLAVEPLQGLDANEVIRRQDVFGHNELAAPSKRPIWSILVAQFRGVVTLLLVAATVLAFLFSDFAEGIAIIVVIVINSSIGFITELRAVRSMENLRQLVRIDCVVVRDGVIGSVAAAELVPGDIVLFEAGDLVPADIRVIEAAKLEADESTLTGESLPVRKTRDALARETPLLDRNNIVFSGTSDGIRAYFPPRRDGESKADPTGGAPGCARRLAGMDRHRDCGFAGDCRYCEGARDHSRC
jgi:Ca2+-transporting ATPase